MIEFLKGYQDNLGAWLPEFLLASWQTLKLMALAFCLATVIGLAIALARGSQLKALRAFAVFYIEVIRGIPALVILFWVYFGLPSVGLSPTSYTAAVLGLGIHGGAFLAEVFRSGIEALHKGQMEGALALGMTPLKAMRYIILPQAVRIVLPPIANYAVGLLKETALCSIIAAPELMLRAKDLASSSFLPMQTYVLAALFYYAMCFPMMRGVEYLEARLRQGR
ncbi:MAG: amino acid ABC transporter permease [Gammaproteobacteria bacterium]